MKGATLVKLGAAALIGLWALGRYTMRGVPLGPAGIPFTGYVQVGGRVVVENLRDRFAPDADSALGDTAPANERE